MEKKGGDVKEGKNKEVAGFSTFVDRPNMKLDNGSRPVVWDVGNPLLMTCCGFLFYSSVVGWFWFRLVWCGFCLLFFCFLF